MDSIKSKIRLLLFLPLILIGGCQYLYHYKYKDIQANAVSFPTSENKIRPYMISSIPPYVPELLVMLDGREIYLRQALTKNEVLDFIKTTKIRYLFGATGPGWRKLDTPYGIDKIDIVLYAKNSGQVKLWFSGKTLIEWSVAYGEGESLKIASPKTKKYYSMPITVLQMKEIFGNPQKVIKDINWK